MEAAPEPIPVILDAETFDNKWFVCGASATRTYCWYDNVLVREVDCSLAYGSYARTWRTKMYRLSGPHLRFSGINNPAQPILSSVTEPGAGFINISLNDPEGEQLESMEVYDDQMALFARLQTQIWKLDPDPTKDTLTQVLRIGTLSPRSCVQFGTGDVLFLSDSGVRSLKAQSSTLTLAASVGDVGSAIDLLLIPRIRDDPSGCEIADAVVQPIQGRYWLAIRDTIYVLSYFPPVTSPPGRPQVRFRDTQLRGRAEHGVLS